MSLHWPAPASPTVCSCRTLHANGGRLAVIAIIRLRPAVLERRSGAFGVGLAAGRAGRTMGLQASQARSRDARRLSLSHCRARCACLDKASGRRFRVTWDEAVVAACATVGQLSCGSRLERGAGAQLHRGLHDGLRLWDAGLFQHPRRRRRRVRPGQAQRRGLERTEGTLAGQGDQLRTQPARCRRLVHGDQATAVPRSEPSTVASSSGFSERRSMTSASMPRPASSSAACRQALTVLA